MIVAAADSGTLRARAAWRRWRVPLLLMAFVLLGGTAAAMLKPVPRATGYLDPAGTGQFGAHALADILIARGHQVISTYSPPAALAAAGSGGATIVITDPDILSAAQLTRLSLAPADIMLVEPARPALKIFAPGVTPAGFPGPTGPVPPRCALSAAQLAGDANVGGITFVISHAPAGAVGCYPVDGDPSLVRYTASGKVVTILGNGEPLANGFLASRGNAALALNLLTTSRRIVWLTPQAGAGGTQVPAGGPRSLLSLIPAAAYLVVLQLGIAVLLAALWRARRLGPLVPEQLPVVVRASETVQGHARLYQARRARDRAAAAMRDAMLGRILPALGLARDASKETVTAALASRSRIGEQAIAEMLFGPPPTSDAGLVTLIADLDALEREVRAL